MAIKLVVVGTCRVLNVCWQDLKLSIAQIINLTFITARKVPLAFLVSGGPVGIPDSEELTEEGQF